MTTIGANQPPAPAVDPMAPAPLGQRPAALLLDFGGVVFSTVKRSDGILSAASDLSGTLARAGHLIEPHRLAASLTAGLAALTHWKHSMSRTQNPVELTHRQVWEEFLLADLDPALRATAAGDAESLLFTLNRHLNDHVVRPGIPEVLNLAASLRVPVGIVSNAHSGRAHRHLLRHHNLESLFAVQLYSDEMGIRKPNPGLLQMAAAALAATPEQCWYVGDTQDRDVVAARRAGVGAVILTESKHTRTPPFEVYDRADAVLPTPEGLVDLLAGAAERRTSRRPAAPAAPAAPQAARAAGLPAALLLDQGGVLTSSVKQPDAIDDLVRLTVERLRLAGHPVTAEELGGALKQARRAYQNRNNDPATAVAPGTPIAETSPREFWGDLVGGRLDPGVRSWLTAESRQLMFAYAAAKSSVELRDGVTDLLTWCRDTGLPVAIVSNTMSGRNARHRLATAGVDHLIGAFAYSDELGRRKPDPALVWAATTALGVDPSDCWYVGDKPWRDVAAGRAAGVGTVVIVRHGSPSADQLEASLTDNELVPDLLLDDIHAVLQALVARTRTSTQSS